MISKLKILFKLANNIFVISLLIVTCIVIKAGTIENVDLSEIFKQEPCPPLSEDRDIYRSDADIGWYVYDDFWELTSPILQVHWWYLPYELIGYELYPCDPKTGTFSIIFYEDNGNNMPGNIICSYDNIIPLIKKTGMMYYYDSPYVHGSLEMYYLEAILEPICEISDGWISIVRTDSSDRCIFGMFNSPDGNKYCRRYDANKDIWYSSPVDLSFVLLGYKNDLNGNGNLRWLDVTPGETKTGNINVENIGGPNTLLNWRIESYIDWGDWTFSPESGDGLKPEDGPVLITVNVIAPNEKNTRYDGELYLVNKDDIHDNYVIPVTLITSKNKQINTSILTFLENNPDLFQLIRQILGLRI